MAKIHIIYIEWSGQYEDKTGKLIHYELEENEIDRAVKLINEHADALCIFGEPCEIIRHETEIKLPKLNKTERKIK